MDDSVDPVRDIQTINNELCIKDLGFVKTAIAAEELAVKKAQGKYKLSPVFIETFDKMVEMLENNIPIRNGEWSTGAVEIINEKVRLITTGKL